MITCVLRTNPVMMSVPVLNFDDIEMFVADCLLDDDIESFELILNALNDQSPQSWASATGVNFAAEDVRIALRGLMHKGFVTPCVDTPNNGGCKATTYEEVWSLSTWDAVWFHLEPAGRDAVLRWQETIGKSKYPLPE